MPGAIELYNTCCQKVGSSHVIILTAIPHTLSSKVGKQEWCKIHFKYAKVICVKRSEKSQYANDHSLLIDDFSKNIEDFIKAGGHGLHYISSYLTIKGLKHLC
jgi:hypothetical protein